MPSGVYERKPFTKEHLQHLSDARKGKKHSKEWCKNISMSRMGHITSEETKKKMSESHKGKPAWNKGIPMTEETRDKMSKSLKNNPTKYWLGKKLDEEHKRKMKESRKSVITEEYRKRISEIMTGRKMPEETKNKIREANKGEKSYRWKGGITSENNKIRNSPAAKEWRTQVFIKDAYTCQKTNMKGCKLEAHHIYGFADFPELRFNPNNGLTLSKEKHREFHKIYGRKNNTKEQLEEFLGKKIDYKIT